MIDPMKCSLWLSVFIILRYEYVTETREIPESIVTDIFKYDTPHTEPDRLQLILKDFKCPTNTFERYPTIYCDVYITCESERKVIDTCPEGKVFQTDRQLCVFPDTADCGQRKIFQKPLPTDVCPHQYAKFKSPDVNKCGEYVQCENGIIAGLFNCSEGLAFDGKTGKCIYPDLVPTCDVERFLRFRCPKNDSSSHLKLYQNPANNNTYFSCSHDRPPRLEVCDICHFFNHSKLSCEFYNGTCSSSTLDPRIPQLPGRPFSTITIGFQRSNATDKFLQE